MQLGWPLPKRRELIERLAKQPTGRLHTVYFQGRPQDLQTHKVSIEFPKYRLDNGRTRSAQAAYLAHHPELSRDFFRSDQEADPAQRAQHEILKSMLGKSDKNLLKFFESRDQMQPLVLTDLGFVVNGNRRLCAFRELVEQEKEANEPRFGQIDVVILPPADERELDRLEALYQLTEDIKEAYSWTARAYMLRARQQEHEFDEIELSAIYRITESEVRDLLDMLSLAEDYLEDQGFPNEYERVDENEFAFRQLLKSRGKQTNERDKEAIQDLSFAVIEKWEQGRLYSVIPRIADNLTEIRKGVEKEFPTATTTTTKSSKAAGLLGVTSVVIDPLTKVLEDKDKRDMVREIISDVLDAAEERNREKKRGALAKLTKAHELMASALNNWKPGNDKVALTAKLDEIEETTKALIRKLNAKSKN